MFQCLQLPLCVYAIFSITLLHSLHALFINSHLDIWFNWFSDVTSNGLTGWCHRRRPVPFGPGHTGSGVAEEGSSYGAKSNCGWHSERLANPILVLDIEMRIESHCDLFLRLATGLSVGLAKGGSAGTAAKTDQCHEQSERRQDEQAIHVVSIRMIYAKYLRHLLYTAKNQGGLLSYLIREAELQASVPRCCKQARLSLIRGG